MKKICLALVMLGLCLPAFQKADAQVSINLFYDNLGGGSWYDVGDYGYVWQPSVAVSNSNWRPYSDGYWAYTDLGWTWVSYEDFGWATYHYGRWARLANYGWVWVPGYEWGPAWVSWRTGGSYVGWAPLPPHGEAIYEGRPIYGRVDVEYDIGPLYYNFVDVRYIGAPVLREHIFAPTRNVTIINNTVNVTNITYTNNRFHNYGPDYEALNRFSNRKIQRLKLQRQENLNSDQALQMGAMTKVQGDTLMVAGPQKVKKADRQVAPKNIKRKIDNPNIERGWAGVGDENVRKQLKKKMESEDLKNPPPMTADASTEAQAGADGKPGAGEAGVAAQTGDDGRKGKKGRKNRSQDPQEGGQTQPIDGQDAEAQANVGQGAQGDEAGKGRNKNKKREAEEAQAVIDANGQASGDDAFGAAQGKGRGGAKAARRLEKQQQRQQEAAQEANEAAQLQDADQPDQGRGRKQQERQEALEMGAPPQGPGDAGQGDNGQGGGRKAQRRLEQQQQQQQQQQMQREQLQQEAQEQQRGGGKREGQGGGGKKKGKKDEKDEGEPQPEG